MSNTMESNKMLPPPQDYDGTIKRLGLWNGISFDQAVKKIFDNWLISPKLVVKDDLVGVFGDGQKFVDLLPKQIFEEVKSDESPTVRMLRDMAKMALSDNNEVFEKLVMINGLVAFVSATCGEGKEWNEANDWLKENGKELISITNKLLNKKKK